MPEPTWCPFCGASLVHPSSYYRLEDGPEAAQHFVECLICKARGPEASTQERAIRWWNDRAPVAAVAAASP